MGLFGGLHCAGMCGPIAALLCTAEKRQEVDVRVALATNAGRLTTYALMGMGVGAVGRRLLDSLPLADVQLVARLVAAAALVLAGLRLAGFLRGARKAGGRTAVRLGWLLERGPGLIRAFGRGAAWGMLPCGLVYAALALALSSGSALGGGATMLAFGVGTFPAIGATILLAGRAAPWLKHASIRAVAGLLLLVSGAAHAAVAVISAGAVPLPEESRPCCASRNARP
jgi:hypothetical protein